MSDKKISEERETPLRVTHYLKAWRDHFGLSAVELARLSGLTGSFISQIEKGRSRYTQQSLEALADALSITPGLLLDVDPNNPSTNIELLFPATFWDSLPEDVVRETRLVIRLAKQALVTFVENYAAERMKMAAEASA